MLTLTTEFQRYTIESYAHYILDDPQVVAFIKKFKDYQSAADKVIDSFEAIVDQGVKFESEQELANARAFNQSTEVCKNAHLQEMIDTLGVEKGWLDNPREVILPLLLTRKASDEPPNKTDLPLYMFRDFITNEHFKDYLFKGTVDLMSGAYFAKDIDLARQKYLVFATFIWIYMKARSDVLYPDGEINGTDTYYDFDIVEEVESMVLDAAISREDFDKLTLAQLSKRSTIQARGDFLADFKDYIHFDMWHDDDYAKRMKKGTTLRLDLGVEETGLVITQSCAINPNICTKTYLISPYTTEVLRREYLKPETELMRLGHFFKCHQCEQRKANFFISHKASGETHFYCDLRCCKKKGINYV